MPLKRGSSAKIRAQNIREFHHGETYKRTKSKFGKDRADAQAIAVAYAQARRKKGK